MSQATQVEPSVVLTDPKVVSRRLPADVPFRLFRGGPVDTGALRVLSAGVDPASVLRRGEEVVGIDVELRQRLAPAPSSRLLQRWIDLHLDAPVIDDADRVAHDVLAARSRQDAPVRVTDPGCARHPEALDFANPINVERNYFYLRDPLHRRRVRMLADTVADQVSELVAARGSATVLEVGPGLSPISRATIAVLPHEVREHVRFTAVDVSEDLLRYGYHRGWLDDGVVADLATLDPSLLGGMLGTADVLVVAEVLEHIPNSAAVFARTMLPWFRESGTHIVGSVPNSVQGVELLDLARGEKAPHQLTRHIVDCTVGHVSFYTYPTLREAMTSPWGLVDPSVWSNGLRLDRAGNALCYDAGLRFPHRGDRLCFAARCR